MARYIVTEEILQLKRVAKALQAIGVPATKAATTTGLSKAQAYNAAFDNRVNADALINDLQSYISKAVNNANEMADA